MLLLNKYYIIATMKKRSHRNEKMARVYDDEIQPIWSQRFGRMLLRGLEVPPKAMVLDVGCGTGYPSLEILNRMDEQGRIIALDPIGPLLDNARKKAGDLAGKRIFFRSEPAVAKLAFADEVYDLVISNLGLMMLDDPALAIQEFARVTKPGGQCIITLPLAGTFGEFYDIYREVLLKHDQDKVLQRLETYLAKTPDVDQVLEWTREAHYPDAAVEVEVKKFTLLFKSSREFFFAPVIEYGPLSEWKEVAGKGQGMQEIFWNIKESIDAYFANRAFETTIKAGCFRMIKPDGQSPGGLIDERATMPFGPDDQPEEDSPPTIKAFRGDLKLDENELDEDERVEDERVEDERVEDERVEDERVEDERVEEGATSDEEPVEDEPIDEER